MASLTPLLTTRGLRRDFGGVRAVDNVNFHLEKGELHAIIGPNGAGKTTLVGLICGRVPVLAGEIFLNGRDITRVPAHHRVRAGIAYTFQATSIFPTLSVFDNVALAVQRRLTDDPAKQLTGRALREKTLDVMEKVGLAKASAQRAGQLSYGHQRLIELAMGVALQPRLLVLDEPTQGLADDEIDRFMALAQQISARATILLIEHNMEVVMALAERITVMDQGKILACGTPAQIRANDAVQRAYLGR